MNLNQNSPLYLAPCSYDAAKYACEHWHYSKAVPASKTVKYGVWEEGEYKGCIIYSTGNNPQIGHPFNLTQKSVCELTRIALREHKYEVSKMISISLNLLQKSNTGLRLVISYADLDQNHLGKIYQASNWYYLGLRGVGKKQDFIIDGNFVHNRTFAARYGKKKNRLKFLKENIDPDAKKVKQSGKLKYAYPLDEDIEQMIKKMSKPYIESIEDIDDID